MITWKLRTPECDHQFPDCCRNNSRPRYTFHPAKPNTPKISAKLPLPLCRLNTLQQKSSHISCLCVAMKPTLDTSPTALHFLIVIRQAQPEKTQISHQKPKEEMKRRTEYTRKREKECSPRLTCKAAKKKTRSKSQTSWKKKKNAKAWNVQKCAARHEYGQVEL